MDYLKKVKFRLVFCSLSFFVIYIGISSYLLKYLKKPEEFVSNNDVKVKQFKRGNILDKNGFIMATSVKTKDLIVNLVLLDPLNFYLNLLKIFNNPVLKN